MKKLAEELWREKNISSGYTENEKKIIYMRYYQGKSVNKIAGELSKSTTYIRKVIKRLNSGKFTSIIVALDCGLNEIEVKENTIEVNNETKDLSYKLEGMHIAVLFIDRGFCKIVKVKDIVSRAGSNIIKYDELHYNYEAKINMTILGDWVSDTMPEPIMNLTLKNFLDICRVL